jgi:CheY-like chemotaxis protein
LLRAEHYDVVTAGGATEATKELRKSRPDLILLDVKMPGKDGVTFCDELAAEPQFADIPIVLVPVAAENVGVLMAAFEKDYASDAKGILAKTAVQAVPTPITSPIVRRRSSGCPSSLPPSCSSRAGWNPSCR